MSRVFVSYAHDDAADGGWPKPLLDHLAYAVRAGVVSAYSDRELQGGDVADEKLAEAMAEADLFVALVSPAFAASDYCNLVELAMAQGREGVRILPVLLEPMVLDHSPFEGMHLLPLGEDRRPKALTLWENRNEALVQVAREILDVVEDRPSRATRLEQAPAQFEPRLALPRLHNFPRRNAATTGRKAEAARPIEALGVRSSAATCPVGGEIFESADVGRTTVFPTERIKVLAIAGSLAFAVAAAGLVLALQPCELDLAMPLQEYLSCHYANIE